MENQLLFSEKAKQIEAAIIATYGCELKRIVSLKDTVEKKVLVFFMYKLLGFNKRTIGHAYQMTYLYVPTVVDEVEIQYMLDEKFREKIITIGKLIGYESKNYFA